MKEDKTVTLTELEKAPKRRAGRRLEGKTTALNAKRIWRNSNEM